MPYTNDHKPGTSVSARQRIAIDMDEVIADPIDKFIEIYQQRHGHTVSLDQMHGKEFREVLPAEISHTLHDYIHEKGFFRDLKIIPGAQEVLEKLSHKYELYIVSAAIEFPNSLEDKLQWLKEHFSFIPWTHIIFCGHKIVNVDIMIDDRTRNFEGFNGRKILFTSPHNENITGYERVNTWQEVADLLL